MKIRTRKKDIKKFFKKNNITDLRIAFQEDYCFYDTTNTIAIGIEKGCYTELLNLVKKLGYDKKYTLPNICFFHELGHYFTYKNFTEEEEKYDTMVREHLYRSIDSHKGKIQEQALKCYYNLPQEITATEYGLKMLDLLKPLW